MYCSVRGEREAAAILTPGRHPPPKKGKTRDDPSDKIGSDISDAARDRGLVGANTARHSAATPNDSAIGEIRSLAPDASTDEGRSLGGLVREALQAMLGDTGRSPPKGRDVLAGDDLKLAPTAPTSLFCIV
jgi:hypothetical protein